MTLYVEIYREGMMICGVSAARCTRAIGGRGMGGGVCGIATVILGMGGGVLAPLAGEAAAPKCVELDRNELP